MQGFTVSVKWWGGGGGRFRSLLNSENIKAMTMKLGGQIVPPKSFPLGQTFLFFEVCGILSLILKPKRC